MNQAFLPVEKTDSIRILGKVDISTIKPLILKLKDQLWEEETARRLNDFNCFHHTQHILFKFQKSSTHPGHFVELPLWQIWEPKLSPIIDQAVRVYHYERGTVPKAMLARLPKFQSIDGHVDGAPRNKFIHKIHIPIQTNPGVLMKIGKQTFHLEEGTAYEVNNIVYHQVENLGSTDRIHFIFEYFNNAL